MTSDSVRAADEEGDVRKPQSKDNIAWFSKDSANETEQERNLLLQTLRTNQARLFTETEQEQNLPLQTLRTNQARRLIHETEQE